jgi:hypothetical protein
MILLKPHQQTPTDSSVKVNYERSKGKWIFNFEVISSQNWQTDKKFLNRPEKNWELWKKDVVEVFFQPRSHAEDFSAPYLELQVSPLNQGFQLMILSPREIFYTPLDLNWDSKVKLGDHSWKSEIQLDWAYDSRKTFFYAGFFACLNKPQCFFSDEHHQTEKPDFHRPEFFRCL